MRTQHLYSVLIAALTVVLNPSGAALRAQTDISCVPVVPTPKSTSNVPPVSTALHFLPPLGSVSGNPANLDRSLTDFLEVRPCDASTPQCAALASLTSQQTKNGMDYVHLLQNKYQVNWKVQKQDVGEKVNVQVLVAGLFIGSTPYQAKAPANVPVELRIDNHPRIRARVLHAQGKSASEITLALISEFHLGGFDVTLLLNDEQFSSIEIALALREAFHATPAQMTAWMRDSAIRPVEIARALFGAYGLASADVAATLRAAGYSSADVFSALKATAPGWTIESGEIALQAAGFCANDVFGAIQPDLVARYEGWIVKSGPILFLDQQELYQLASIPWYMQNSYVHWTLPDGSCPTTADLANGGPCNTAVGKVTPEELIGFIEQQFVHNAPFLTANGIDPKDEIAVQQFVESLDIRVIEKDDSVFAGQPSVSTAYVNVIRNKTPGAPEFGTTDLQFWFFYPYNGPGTIESDTYVFGLSYHPSKTLDPLGTHIPDWENATLRFDTATGDLIQVTGTQHGAVRDLATGLVYDGTHPVLYSSRNGHSVWSGTGDNPIVIKDYTDHLSFLETFGIKISGLNFTSQGFRFDSSSSSQLVSVYDTCVNANDPTPGLCEGVNPVQPVVETPPDPTHNVVPVWACRYLDGALVIPPGKEPPLPAGATSAQLMESICPRPFTAHADGTAAPNTEWWLMGRFGPEKDSVLAMNAWEEWVNVDFGPLVAGAIATVCSPFWLLGPEAYFGCVAAATGVYEIALPFVKDAVINYFLPPPGSPPSPYWHPCELRSDGSC
jgi:hypothetical protein